MYMSLSPVQRIHMLKPPFKCQHKYFVCEELLFRENATGIWEGDLNSLNQIVQKYWNMLSFQYKRSMTLIMIIFIMNDYFYYTIPPRDGTKGLPESSKIYF